MKIRFWFAVATLGASASAFAAEGAKPELRLDKVEVNGLIVRVPVSTDGQINFDAAEYRVDAGSTIRTESDLARAFAESPDASAMGTVTREAVPATAQAAEQATEAKDDVYTAYPPRRGGYQYNYNPYYYSYNYRYPYNNYPNYRFTFNYGYSSYYNSPGLYYNRGYNTNPYYYRYYYYGRRW